MIKNNYEGLAYYFYEYNDIAEFGYFNISIDIWSNISFNCKVIFFFGYSSNIDIGQDTISSNQLHGQNATKEKYQNWYLNIDQIENKHLLIKTIFEAKNRLI